MIIKSTLTIISLFISILLTAQSSSLYFPIKNYSPEKESIKNYILIYEKEAQKFYSNDKKIDKEFKKMILENASFLLDANTSNQLMAKDSISLYLQRLIEQIKYSNDELRARKLDIYIYRNAEPNAFNEGPQVILINLGLLERVRNVEELVFVICHELAHEYLNHVIISIQELCNSIYNSEFKKTERKILKQPYNRIKDHNNLVLEVIKTQMLHSRKHEFEADSLALKFMFNAGFDTRYSLSCMDLLDSTNYFNYSDTIHFYKHFSFSNLPFKKSYLQNEITKTEWNRDNSLTFIPDSLKTHPDCVDRKSRISNSLAKNNWYNDKNLQTLEFPFRNISSFELINQLIIERDYVFALYKCLYYLNTNPENLYLNLTVVHCLFELGFSKRNHSSSKYIDFPDPEFPMEYNQLLEFLNNVNSKYLNDLLNLFYSKNCVMANSSGFYYTFVNTLISFENKTKKQQIEIIKNLKLNYPDDLDIIQSLNEKIKN